MFFRSKHEGLKLLSEFFAETDDGYYFIKDKIPASSARIVFSIDDSFKISKLICDLMSWESKVIFHITEYGIFPSSQNDDMLRSIRGSYGCFDTVDEKPSTIVLREDAIRCATYAQTCIVNYLGFIVASPDLVASVSHDGSIDFFFVRDKKSEFEKIATYYKTRFSMI